MPPQPSSIDYLNVVIHGLFFMTVNPVTENLEIYAPKVPDHHFICGIRPDRLQFAGGVIDWSNPKTALSGGTPNWPKTPQGTPDKTKIPLDVKSSILQFTPDETGIGGFDSNASLEGKIILPWPAEFYSLRCDLYDKYFHLKAGSVVGAKVKKRCRDTGNLYIGSATCFRYGYRLPTFPFLQDWAPGDNIQFYLQTCNPEEIADVNTDLDNVANVAHLFQNPQSFDFRFDTKQKNPPTSVGQGHCNAPLGIAKEDEWAFYDDPDIDKSPFCPAHNFKEDHPDPGEAINPANCPNFFVGP